MSVRTAGDPRLDKLFGIEAPQSAGVRPIVPLSKARLSGWMIAAGALIAAVILLWSLESRRQASRNHSAIVSDQESNLFASKPPPLFVPAPMGPPVSIAFTPGPVVTPVPLPQLQPRDGPPLSRSAPVWIPDPAQSTFRVPQDPVAERVNAGPVLVFDTGETMRASDAVPDGAVTAAQTIPSGGQISVELDRARASTLADRSMTVVQGTLIPAVLETALDSTRPGFARAIVSQNVRGFDGRNILIPRGSRVVGVYGPDASPGQKRAVIRWTRLVRPDGVTIAINSPSADRLGRGGIPAQVNSHFLARFGDSLLQSAIDLGRSFTTGRGAGVVLVPGGQQVGMPTTNSSDRYAPTLKVPAATSISIFVSRDLEFAAGGDSG